MGGDGGLARSCIKISVVVRANEITGGFHSDNETQFYAWIRDDFSDRISAKLNRKPRLDGLPRFGKIDNIIPS